MKDEWIVGRHAVEAALERRRDGVREVLVLEGRGGRVVELARAAGLPVRNVDRQRLDVLAGGLAHNGIAARVAAAPAARLEDLTGGESGSRLVLLLDGVEDPRNLGAILRVAAGFGAVGVVAPKDRAAPLSEAARKVAAGAAERVRFVQVPNLSAAIETLRDSGFWIYGADAGGETASAVDLRRDVALVLGGEGKGLRRLTRERCDGLLGIPIGEATESLNVATAGAVLAYEIRRQQGFPGLRHGD